MARVPKIWRLSPHDPDAVRALANDLRVSPVVAQLLVNRGVVTPDAGRRFLKPELGGLHPPHLMPGVPEAADRIAAAAAAGRKICVYGDYDVDGVTGTAVLVGLIRKLGGTAEFYIPHRMDEGYGLNLDAVRQLREGGVELLVTVDCGITAVAEADEARALGLELIITDHHEFGPRLPKADVLVHPRLPGSQYPFGELSGSGVAFKLAWAVAQKASGGERATPELREFLLDAVGIAALGLVADVVPLRDENRIFVKHGLTRLASHPGVGMRALIDVVGLSDKPVTSEDVSFKLAPRLNAAGRLGCAVLVVELLTTKNSTRARELAECLNGYNVQRQTIERKITQQVKDFVVENGFATDPGIVVGGADWHQGVIGIVAGRLVEHFGRPVVLVAEKEDDAPSTGSGRSVPGFALHEALQACTAELEGHGGHAMAAGVRVRPSKLAAFRAAFNAYAAGVFPAGPPAPVLTVDAEVPLSSVTFGLMKDIDRLEPYGAGNARPRFLAAGLQILDTPRRIGQGERHLSFRVRQGNTTLRAVAFGMGDRLDEIMSQGGVCCLAFAPKINEWNDFKSVEITVEDVCAGPTPPLG